MTSKLKGVQWSRNWLTPKIGNFLYFSLLLLLLLCSLICLLRLNNIKAKYGRFYRCSENCFLKWNLNILSHGGHWYFILYAIPSIYKQPTKIQFAKYKKKSNFKYTHFDCEIQTFKRSIPGYRTTAFTIKNRTYNSLNLISFLTNGTYNKKKFGVYWFRFFCCCLLLF